MTGKPFVGRMLRTRENTFCDSLPRFTFTKHSGKFSKHNILYKVDRFHICSDTE